MSSKSHAGKVIGGAPAERVVRNHSAMAHIREPSSLPLNSKRIKTKRFGFAVASKASMASCAMANIRTCKFVDAKSIVADMVG